MARRSRSARCAAAWPATTRRCAAGSRRGRAAAAEPATSALGEPGGCHAHAGELAAGQRIERCRALQRSLAGQEELQLAGPGQITQSAAHVFELAALVAAVEEEGREVPAALDVDIEHTPRLQRLAERL